MKIIETLVYIMAVGTITSGMAQTQVDIDLRSIVPFFASQIRQMTTGLSTFTDDRARQAVREKCEKNGGPFAFGNATAALRDFQNSVDLLTNETIRDARLNILRPRLDQDEFAKLCGMIQTVNTFAAQSLKLIEPCFEPEEQQSGTRLANITSSMTNYICENNGSRLVSFWRDHGVECLANKSRVIKTCNRVPHPVRRSSDNKAVVDSIGLPWSVSSTYIKNIEECRRMDSLNTCFLQHFQSCEKPTSSKVISDIYNYYKDITGCKNLLEAQTPAAVKANGVESADSDNVKSDVTSN